MYRWLLMVGLLVITGCGSTLVPLTQELRQQHQLTADELRNLQYYVSDPITLRRELQSGGRQVTGTHSLRIVAGKTIEEVVIEERTPGVAIEVSGDTIVVSFEEGTSLVFRAENRGQSDAAPSREFADAPNPFPGNDPEGQPSGASSPDDVGFGDEAADARGPYLIEIRPDGTIVFQGRSFEAADGTFRAHLLIDAESLEDVVERRTVLGGRTLE